MTTRALSPNQRPCTGRASLCLLLKKSAWSGATCFFTWTSPVRAKSLACGSGVATRRRDMTTTERYGADLFRTANACVMLDESNRFTTIYAPITERCLRQACTSDDVGLIN
ncbi:unnamed protein product, partial [Ectocarpus sp. 13 AM-2016]